LPFFIFFAALSRNAGFFCRRKKKTFTKLINFVWYLYNYIGLEAFMYFWPINKLKLKHTTLTSISPSWLTLTYAKWYCSYYSSNNYLWMNVQINWLTEIKLLAVPLTSALGCSCSDKAVDTADSTEGDGMDSGTDDGGMVCRKSIKKIYIILFIIVISSTSMISILL
jgi:hypothetical protein